MSTATLTFQQRTAVGLIWRTALVDCRHGTTRSAYANVPGGAQLTDGDAARLALLKHHREEGCRCTRLLWRRYFGCRWPEVPLVRGTSQ